LRVAKHSELRLRRGRGSQFILHIDDEEAGRASADQHA